MRFTKYFLMLMAAGFCFCAPICLAEKDAAYVVEEQGRSTWRALVDKKMQTSADQWGYARETQNKGKLKKAERRMIYLVRRWPNSKEAPWAQRARADMLYSRGDLKEAFTEYQYLIDNYSSRMLDYDSVLESQFTIALDIMKRRRMRWFFGGYRAPEYAVDYFEDIIRNGPQSPKAPHAQFLIGQAYKESGELELAISAYSVLGYRYPDSIYSEEALWHQIACFEELNKEYPNSQDILDRTLTATTIFLSTYPESSHKSDIIRLRNRLYEVKAQKSFDEAEFYAKVPKKPQAAILYYQNMIEEFPKSKLVPEAEKRISELEAFLNVPARVLQKNAPPTLQQPTVEKEKSNADH